ncbi:hypothetical protein BBO99_00007743 [Phytophthora kernoviae]|uniref:Uncharacterized protein n=1 Tax=Phytophthora kernoviae TaxID=325452 RepID=A0A3R7GV21_9STRA|nr:hypothetical protein BBI17_006926 [Phytophthora kernoviae]RLN76203.1 hypothetical protein BBO99_00007743 [Phytophthora kernoviae]
MSLTRRNVGPSVDSALRERSGSTIWEDEADEYWKNMEPAKRCRRFTSYTGALVLALLVGGAVFISARTALDEGNIAALKERFAPLLAVATTGNSTVKNAVESTPVVPEAATTVAPVADLPLDASAQELLRSRCRVRGVQSRWHEETCRKLCVRDPHNPACMNGCSYGSLTVTKLVCDKLEAADVPTASRCPDGVSCMEACRAYDEEKPFPELRNTCVRGCSDIVPSACARSLQIYRDLLQGTLQ